MDYRPYPTTTIRGRAVTRVARNGDQPIRAAPSPLWGSDHFGVTARIVSHER